MGCWTGEGGGEELLACSVLVLLLYFWGLVV